MNTYTHKYSLTTKMLSVIVLFCLSLPTANSYALRPAREAQFEDDNVFLSQGITPGVANEDNSQCRAETYLDRNPEQLSLISEIYERLHRREGPPVQVWCLGASYLLEPISIARRLLEKARSLKTKPNFCVIAVEADSRLLEYGREKYLKKEPEGVKQRIRSIHNNFIYPRGGNTLKEEIKQADIIVINNVAYQLEDEARQILVEDIMNVKAGCIVIMSDREFNGLFTADSAQLNECFDIRTYTEAGEDPALIDTSYYLTRRASLLIGPFGRTEEDLTLSVPRHCL